MTKHETIFIVSQKTLERRNKRDTNNPMKITWDEPKRLANLDKHGMDFADLTLDFFLGSVVVPANGKRYMALGRLEDGTIAVIFARLGSEGIAVISMRRASVKERKLLT